MEPKYINETRGKGLFATRDFKIGEVVFQEDALMQAMDPECLVCSLSSLLFIFFFVFISLSFLFII